MTRRRQEGGQLCDARSDSYRVVCERPKGHVNSLEPADWHEAHATTSASLSTNVVRSTTRSEETIRWRPNIFELPGEKRTAAMREMVGDS